MTSGCPFSTRASRIRIGRTRMSRLTPPAKKMAHVIINGDEKYGPDRQKHASTAPPIGVSEWDRPHRWSDPSVSGRHSDSVESEVCERRPAGSSAQHAIRTVQQLLYQRASVVRDSMAQYVSREVGRRSFTSGRPPFSRIRCRRLASRPSAQVPAGRLQSRRISNCPAA